MLELAQVIHLATAYLPSDPAMCLAGLGEHIIKLPTHSVRREDQIAPQQFSTPAPIVYLTAIAARIGPGDLVLEPSAGTGLLAAFVRCAGARCLIPEFDGALFTPGWKEALWARYSMGAPQRLRQSVERYSRVKRA